MTDLLHWYARAHGPRAYRVVRAALDDEHDTARPDAAAEPSEVGATVAAEARDPAELTAGA